MDTYWTKATGQRLSRRRALALTGSGVLGAAFLAACGGNDSGDSKDGTGKSSLLYTPADSTKNAAKGGILQSSYANEPLNYDPLSSSSQFTFGFAHHAYQRFFSLKAGTATEPSTGEPEGDAVQSWEYSPDGLQLTMKLRQNKLDPRPPTSSRLLNSDDVKWSWDRFIALQPGNRFFANSLSPDAPVTSMTFPDASTVVMKLAFPMGALTRMLGTVYYFALLPVEAESKFDFRQDMRGSGAWMMTKYERSVGWEFRRNPNWYRASERPFLEGIDYALISDTANALAQLKAKRLWFGKALNFSSSAVPGTEWLAPDSVLPLKREQADLQMIANSPLRGQGSITYIGMSKLAESKWEKDVRLRQALSMVIDREAYIDAFSNVRGFEKEGLPMEVGWNTHVPSSWPTIWLNPQKNELGDSSKYLQFQPDEAAKLLRAANAFGAEDTITYAADGRFGTAKQLDVLVQMMNQGGHFKIKQNPEDYTTVITPKYTFGKGQYPDLGTHPLGSWSDWDIALWNTFSPSGRNDYVGHETPVLKEIMVRHRKELDLKKRNDIAKEWQRAVAKEMPIVPFPGQATVFSLGWPWLGNSGWHETAGGGVNSQETAIHLWYDKSKDTRTS